MPETRSYRTSGSFDLFPQHCLLPKFTPKQHANEVHDELMDAIQKLEAPAKKLILTKLTAAMQSLAASTAPQPIQRLAEPDPEEGRSIQRVNQSPTITTSTNPTAPRTLKAKPRTHLRKTRANTPKTVQPSKILRHFQPVCEGHRDTNPTLSSLSTQPRLAHRPIECPSAVPT